MLEFKKFFSVVCMVTMGMDKLSTPASHALMSLLMVAWGISCNSLMRACSSSWMVLGRCSICLMHLPRMFQTSSSGFKCGDLASQSITAIPVWCWYTWQCVDEHYHAWEIRMKSSPTAPANSLTMGSKTSFLYFWALMWPFCSTYRSVHPFKDMHPHTIKDPLSKASCATMLHAAKHSPCCL